MHRLATLIFFAALVVSCKDAKPVFPYLNDKLNQPAQISNAELKVLYFQRRVSSEGYRRVMTTTGNYPLIVKYIYVSLSGGGVYVNPHFEIAYDATRAGSAKRSQGLN